MNTYLNSTVLFPIFLKIRGADETTTIPAAKDRQVHGRKRIQGRRERCMTSAGCDEKGRLTHARENLAPDYLAMVDE
ncbi:hypothetical protein [Paraburkholderia sp. SIMBA_054]|jgi:hypothetical protein|uniref:hypothetical protein n=1 Tax=Paraburkholderia sp. SIMBA_054 TaxID=3085795 RepID=UPI00397A04EA